jgi:hypothetical protein
MNIVLMAFACNVFIFSLLKCTYRLEYQRFFNGLDEVL